MDFKSHLFDIDAIPEQQLDDVPPLPRLKWPRVADGDDPPSVRVSDEPPSVLNEFAADCVMRLMSANPLRFPPVVECASGWVRPDRVTGLPSGDLSGSELRAWWADALARCGSWLHRRRADGREVWMSLHPAVSAQTACAGSGIGLQSFEFLGVPKFAALSRTPFLWGGGLVCEQGLHAPSGTMLMHVPPVLCSVEEARERLRLLAHDFPFVSEQSRALFYAALFSGIVAPEVWARGAAVPAVLVTKPMSQSGATTLLRVLASVGWGQQEPFGVSWGRNEQEFEWALSAEMRRQRGGLLSVDNVPMGETVSASSLHRMIGGEPMFSGRAVGSGAFTVPVRSQVCLTGIGVSLGAEMSTRAMQVLLAAARPAGHAWALPGLDAWIGSHAVWFRDALLSCVQHWLDVCAPMVAAGPARFRAFCSTVTSIMAACGLPQPDWGEAFASSAAGDDLDWEQFMAWMSTLGWVNTSDLLPLLRERADSGEPVPGALTESGSVQKLGRQLQARKGALFGAWTLRYRRSVGKSYWSSAPAEPTVPDVDAERSSVRGWDWSKVRVLRWRAIGSKRYEDEQKQALRPHSVCSLSDLARMVTDGKYADVPKQERPVWLATVDESLQPTGLAAFDVDAASGSEPLPLPDLDGLVFASRSAGGLGWHLLIGVAAPRGCAYERMWQCAAEAVGLAVWCGEHGAKWDDRKDKQGVWFTGSGECVLRSDAVPVHVTAEPRQEQLTVGHAARIGRSGGGSEADDAREAWDYARSQGTLVGSNADFEMWCPALSYWVNAGVLPESEVLSWLASQPNYDPKHDPKRLKSFNRGAGKRLFRLAYDLGWRQ